MYERFYGLKEKPFQITPNPHYLYMSSVHEKAITYLEYGLSENVGFILFTGEIGAGKTTMVRHILDQFESEKEIGAIFNTNVTANELLCLILRSFNLEPENENKTKNLTIFQEFLLDRYAKKRQVLLIIDEAQNLSDEALEQVRMLSNLQSNYQNLIQIMLVGQPELKDRLKQPDHISFSQRIAVNFFLSGLTNKETRSYIAYRLEKAGGNPDIFSPEAVDMIYHVSQGIPRTINLLCDAALVYGFGYEFDIIEAPVVEQVIKDKGGMGIKNENEDQETTSSSTSEQKTKQENRDRLQVLEDALHLLQQQLDSLGKIVQQQAKKNKKLKEELIDKLKTLLLQERKRSDELLVSYSQLKVKFDYLMKAQSRDLSDQKWIEGLIKNELEKLLKNIGQNPLSLLPNNSDIEEQSGE